MTPFSSVEKLGKIYIPMILNGDNKKIFIKGDKIYKVGQYGVSEYSKDDFVELRRRDFCGIKSAKEFDGKYYFHTKNDLLSVYEDLFQDAICETEIQNSGIFDFHVYDGQVFYIGKKMNRCLGFDENQRLLFDFQMGSYVWNGPSFYICHDRSLIKFDLIKKTSESILKGVAIKSFAIRDGMIAYADDANILHFVNRGKILSYHYHARPVVGIIITDLESLLVICRDKKLVRIETRRDEKVFLSEFYGDALDFIQDGVYTYVLTTFGLLIYDMKAGSVRRHIFNLPDFEYCKPFQMLDPEDSASTSGKEIFEKNVKKTKAKLPYAFEKEEFGCISRNSIVAIKRDYVFIYDLAGKEIQKIAHFKGTECFYSSGHIITFAGKGQRKTTIKIYRIDNDGLSLVKREDSTNIMNIPEDIILENGRVFLYSNGRLFELTISGILKQIKNRGVKQIEETEAGVYILDSCGVCRVESCERILEDEGITSFKILNDAMYVSSFGAGVARFVMKDGAIEERLIDGMNIVDIFTGDDIIITSNLQESIIVLKKYVRGENGWIKNGELAAGGEVSKVLYDNVYLSVRNKLHEISF